MCWQWPKFYNKPIFPKQFAYKVHRWIPHRSQTEIKFFPAFSHNRYKKRIFYC